jgi:hypothetical protein
MIKSAAPAFSLRNNILSQVFPPSLERKTPRGRGWVPKDLRVRRHKPSPGCGDGRGYARWAGYFQVQSWSRSYPHQSTCRLRPRLMHFPERSEEEHTVAVGKVLSWLDGGARSPREHPHGLALLWLLDRNCNQIRGRDSADAELQRYDASLHLRHGDVDLIQADELR